MDFMRRCALRAAACWLALAAAVAGGGAPVHAKDTSAHHSATTLYAERRLLFEQMGAVTGIPWYMLAAVDQYERTMARVRPGKEEAAGLIAIRIPDDRWTGMLNPDAGDVNPVSIAWYGGLGRDGDGDGKADPDDGMDQLYSMIRIMLANGLGTDHIRSALWDYYHNPRSLTRIDQFAAIYRTFGRLGLDGHVFVLPLGSDYSFRDTWGASRGWGGRRIHEGTDLFAHYGVPVRSTCYGIVEIMGWNPYGGWRVGIRSIHNVYHYYAHLSGFNKQFRESSVVKPGDVIGYVGNSGYGKPGTQGKFPPHLHYGLYRDGGLTDWAFDPYGLLRRWEREERRSRRG